jgi:hypothetical protein
MSLISAGSFSPDSTFKLGCLPNHTYLHRFYSVLSSHHHLFLSTYRFGLKNLHILNGASGSLFWRQLPTVKKLTPSYRLPITRHRSFFFSFKTGLKLINNITLSTPTKFLLQKLLGCRDGVFRPA